MSDGLHTPTLFSQEEAAETVAKPEPQRPYFYSIIARRKLGLDDTFKWCQVSSIKPDGIMIVVKKTYIKKSGKNKGKIGFQNPTFQTFTTVKELNDEKLNWEKTTKKCHECYGTGQSIASISAKHGKTYKDCERCKATGIPPEDTKEQLG